MVPWNLKYHHHYLEPLLFRIDNLWWLCFKEEASIHSLSAHSIVMVMMSRMMPLRTPGSRLNCNSLNICRGSKYMYRHQGAKVSHFNCVTIQVLAPCPVWGLLTEWTWCPLCSCLCSCIDQSVVSHINDFGVVE
jgi:hypothetical protein